MICVRCKTDWSAMMFDTDDITTCRPCRKVEQRIRTCRRCHHKYDVILFDNWNHPETCTFCLDKMEEIRQDFLRDQWYEEHRDPLGDPEEEE